MTPIVVILVSILTVANTAVLVWLLHIFRTHYHTRLERVERLMLVMDDELFREGLYPDMGLRSWARVWRDRLRGHVAVLDARLARVERWMDRETTVDAEQAAFRFHVPPRDN